MPGFWALNSCSRARALSACSLLTAQKDQVIFPPGAWPAAGERSPGPPAPPAVQAASAGTPATRAGAAAPSRVRRVAVRAGIVSSLAPLWVPVLPRPSAAPPVVRGTRGRGDGGCGDQADADADAAAGAAGAGARGSRW